jgi:hypothetical protein
MFCGCISAGCMVSIAFRGLLFYGGGSNVTSEGRTLYVRVTVVFPSAGFCGGGGTLLYVSDSRISECWLLAVLVGKGTVGDVCRQQSYRRSNG